MLVRPDYNSHAHSVQVACKRGERLFKVDEGESPDEANSFADENEELSIRERIKRSRREIRPPYSRDRRGGSHVTVKPWTTEDTAGAS